MILIMYFHKTYTHGLITLKVWHSVGWSSADGVGLYKF